MAQKALVIDQDDLERRRVVRELAKGGMAVVEASGTVEGLLDVLEEAPDVIVMAEEMPPLEAEDLLSLLRRLTDAPLIILGSGSEPTEVSVLERGADVYLRRPFSSASVLAWTRAVLRRYHPSSFVSGVYFRINGLARALTATEKRLLVWLAANGTGLTSQGELLARVWRGNASADAAKFYLRRLRHKLEEAACGLRLVSVRGVGHRLVQVEGDGPPWARGCIAGGQCGSNPPAPGTGWPGGWRLVRAGKVIGARG